MKSIRAMFLWTLTLAASLCAAPAFSQQFSMGTGSKDLTYNRQFKEIQKVCGKDLAMVEISSNGAVQNAERLIGNEINGGWVQADILYMMAKNQDLSDIKTLLVMNPESAHFIVKDNLAVKQGGTGYGNFKVGGTEVKISELSQIAGMTVAASGGGAWSAKQIRLESEVPYNILEVADAKAAIAALDKDAQVALIMGGYPVDYVKTLGKGYRLLTIPDTMQKKLKAVYLPDTISYSNLADGGTAQTVSVQSLVVTREYKSAKMVSALSSFKNCVLSNLDDIRETTGNHASWRKIKAENQSQAKWPLYQLPTATVSKK
jgi:TRAP-type uncharacterized transport system substrate-binding protein